MGLLDLLLNEVATAPESERMQVGLVQVHCCASQREQVAWLKVWLRLRQSMTEAEVAAMIEETLDSSLLEAVGLKLLCQPNSQRSPHDRWFFTEFWPRFSRRPAYARELWDLLKRRDTVSWRFLNREDRGRNHKDLMPVKRSLLDLYSEIPRGGRVSPATGLLGIDRSCAADYFFMMGFHACLDRDQRGKLVACYTALAAELYQELPRGQQHPDPNHLTFRELWTAVIKGEVVALIERAGLSEYLKDLPPRYIQFMKLGSLVPKASVWRLMQLIIRIEAIDVDESIDTPYQDALLLVMAEVDWGFHRCSKSRRAELTGFYRDLLERFEDPMPIENARQSGNFLQWCEANSGREIPANIRLALSAVSPTPRPS
ncbi:hypothetical protein MAPG_03488 [Magnaporthiopsis poae ATCC 64411]|uniref:Uncharacterized protein n=1 Tax=Magnaporthiopsis poae (strain ATCC 64411 / 73-15) TaxID=644358 RepID=A0A0C4DU53_MAGP6|nr:hypothetical protein MAPG_03488 [Magnaporthiopsis poae ATCC 64411]